MTTRALILGVQATDSKWMRSPSAVVTFHDGGEAGIAVGGECVVEDFAAHAGAAGQFADVARASDGALLASAEQHDQLLSSPQVAGVQRTSRAAMMSWLRQPVVAGLTTCSHPNPNRPASAEATPHRGVLLGGVVARIRPAWR
jgi:hypothetical protein